MTADSATLSMRTAAWPHRASALYIAASSLHDDASLPLPEATGKDGYMRHISAGRCRRRGPPARAWPPSASGADDFHATKPQRQPRLPT